MNKFPTIQDIKNNNVNYFTYKGTTIYIEKVCNWVRFSMRISHFNNTYGVGRTVSIEELEQARNINVIEYIIEGMYKKAINDMGDN